MKRKISLMEKKFLDISIFISYEEKEINGKNDMCQKYNNGLVLKSTIYYSMYY